MNELNAQPLNLIIGSELSSVEFVRDYIQLRFDGPSLTAITPPIIRSEENNYEWEMSGYCDVLRKCIGMTLHDASVLLGKEIYLEFDNGVRITISLNPEDYVGPEAVVFNDGQQGVWVW